jgi:hypothetical protein
VNALPVQESALHISEAILDAALSAWAAAGRRSRWPVAGTSLWPLLQPGDVIEVVHDPQEIHNGDLVVYRAGERAVVHRVLRRSDRGLLLGSDHLPAADALVLPAAVIGRVVTIHAGVRRLDLTTRPARFLGRLLAACHPLRSCRGLRRLIHFLAHLQRRILS